MSIIEHIEDYHCKPREIVFFDLSLVRLESPDLMIHTDEFGRLDKKVIKEDRQKVKRLSALWLWDRINFLRMLWVIKSSLC